MGSDRSLTPFGLVLDADAVRHARHVVEVGDDLNGVADRCVVEAVGAQRVDVGGVDLRREMRQPDREVAEGALSRREARLAVVVCRVLRELVVCALCTEVVGVCLRSVVAVLLGRSHRGEQLAFLP